MEFSLQPTTQKRLNIHNKITFSFSPSPARFPSTCHPVLFKFAFNFLLALFPTNVVGGFHVGLCFYYFGVQPNWLRWPVMLSASASIFFKLFSCCCMCGVLVGSLVFGFASENVYVKQRCRSMFIGILIALWLNK